MFFHISTNPYRGHVIVVIDLDVDCSTSTSFKMLGNDILAKFCSSANDII
jgi:hypothetical protein